MMKDRTIYIVTAMTATAVLWFSSCVKDDLYNTPHPDSGAVVVTTDWNGCSPEAEMPQSYILRVGENEQTVGGATNLLDALLAPGTYALTAYNVPQGMTLDGNTATVDGTADGARAAGGIEPHPGYLFSSHRDISVTADDTLHVTCAMRQLVRRLDIELTATEGDYNRVTAATATLDGVATSVDITTGTLARDAAHTSAPFTREDNRFALFFRLLGVVPTEAQTLTVSIRFDDGSVQTVESDLTEQLAGFNTGTGTGSVKLTGNLRLPLEAEVGGGSITGWTETDGGNVDAI